MHKESHVWRNMIYSGCSVLFGQPLKKVAAQPRCDKYTDQIRCGNVGKDAFGFW